MIFFLCITVPLFWIILRLWRNRGILKLSRMLQNQYTSWPIIGHGLMFQGSPEERMKTIEKFGREALNSKHGLTGAWLGSQFCVVTCDSMTAEIVAKACLGKTEEVSNFARPLLGNASIFAPVNIWRPRRKMLAPAFSAKNFREFSETFAKLSIVLTNSLKSKAGRGTFPIWKYITSYTMDSICQTIFGLDMGFQALPLNPVLSAVHKYYRLVTANIILFNPKLEWLFKLLPIYKEAEKNKKIIQNVVDEIISKKRASHISADSQNNVQNKSFLDQLIMSSGNNGHGCTDVEIREETVVLLLAGNDISAVGISFAIMMLSRHLDVQAKAYEEVSKIFGDSTRLVTYEDLPNLKYIEAFIKESLRLFPPVPVIIRENDIEITLSSGIVLPAGTYTAIHIWAIHRNQQYWGADAEQFNPDRFLKAPLTNRTAFMPFSYGPRDCLGHQNAMILMKIALVTLLRNYKILPPSDMSAEDLSKPLRQEFSITLKDVNNFEVCLEHRI